MQTDDGVSQITGAVVIIDKLDELARTWHRASVTFLCVVGFVPGCAAGAVLEVHFSLWALALPVALAVIAISLNEARER